MARVREESREREAISKKPRDALEMVQRKPARKPMELNLTFLVYSFLICIVIKTLKEGMRGSCDQIDPVGLNREDDWRKKRAGTLLRFND